MADKNQNLPNHLGFIMDGNRRWARDQGLQTFEGHRQGYESLKKIVEYAAKKKIKNLSFYAFSTENWARSKKEVSFLMDLILKMMTRDLAEIKQKGVRIFWLGSEAKLSSKLVEALNNAVEVTKDNTKINVGICFNYGGQMEIVEAVKKIIEDNLKPEEIEEKTLSRYLYSPELPAVDMVIRTSGERRISNFMLWRVAYSEMYFINKHWPDFEAEDFDDVLLEYGKRQRRFGN